MDAARLPARRPSPALGWAALLLLCGAGAEGRGGAAPPRQAASDRAAVVELLSRTRAERGLPPLRWVEPLSVAAQAEADALAAQAKSFPSRRPELLAQLPYAPGDLIQRLAEAGYEAAEAKATLIVGEAAPAEALGRLLEPGESFHDQFLVNDLEDLGLGVAPLDDVAFMVVILGRSQGDRFAAAVRSLPEPSEVRWRLLEETNGSRRRHRRQPLRPDPCLDAAAQSYAERMLAEGFFGHVAPEGDSLEDRLRAARCRAQVVAENLAEGPLTPVEAVAGWMESPLHRRNVLDPVFTRVGFGLAWGSDGDGSRIFWVQLLAR